MALVKCPARITMIPHHISLGRRLPRLSLVVQASAILEFRSAALTIFFLNSLLFFILIECILLTCHFLLLNSFLHDSPFDADELTDSVFLWSFHNFTLHLCYKSFISHLSYREEQKVFSSFLVKEKATTLLYSILF